MAWTFWHDYEYRRVNWIEFTFIACSWEQSNIYGGSEIHVALLGLHARVDWTHNAGLAHEFREKCEADIADFERERLMARRP